MPFLQLVVLFFPRHFIIMVPHLRERIKAAPKGMMFDANLHRPHTGIVNPRFTEDLTRATPMQIHMTHKSGEGKDQLMNTNYDVVLHRLDQKTKVRTEGILVMNQEVPLVHTDHGVFRLKKEIN